MSCLIVIIFFSSNETVRSIFISASLLPIANVGIMKSYVWLLLISRRCRCSSRWRKCSASAAHLCLFFLPDCIRIRITDVQFLLTHVQLCNNLWHCYIYNARAPILIPKPLADASFPLQRLTCVYFFCRIVSGLELQMINFY